MSQRFNRLNIFNNSDIYKNIENKHNNKYIDKIFNIV